MANKFLQCKHRFGMRFAQVTKTEGAPEYDEKGKLTNAVLDKQGKPVILPEVFLPEAERNMIIMVGPAEIERLEASPAFRDLMAKGDYVYHDKMPESAKNDSIRLAEKTQDLEEAQQEIERLKSLIPSEKGKGKRKDTPKEPGEGSEDEDADTEE
jgi:hypothetical protein